MPAASIAPAEAYKPDVAGLSSITVPGWLRPMLSPRSALRSVFVGALLVAAGAVLLMDPLPVLGPDQQLTLAVLACASLAAEVFTVDFPDRKRISGSYIFPLVAAALIAPPAAPFVAGAAGLVGGLWSRQRLRSTLFHAPRLVLAAALASWADRLVFGPIPLTLNARGALAVVLFTAIYTTAAWGLSWIEETIGAQTPGYPSVDLLTNLLLVPLPLVLGLIYDQTGWMGLRLSALALTLLLVIVRAYVNLATLHRELRQAYQRVAAQEQQLETALETNREMSQIVSHDLRGPLTSVMGYAELLRSALTQAPIDTPKLARYVDSVENNSRRIMNLADKLLDLHRLEQGEQLELAPVDLNRLLRQILDEQQIQADTKHIAVSLDLPATAPVVNSSEWMLHEIAQNLLSNAIKYTLNGGRVQVRLAPTQVEVELQVEDTGIGMSQEDQAQLFTKFFRGGSRDVRQVQGTGLGLALTRGMIEKLGGRVEVWSEQGKGSRFTVHLPLEVPA